MMIRDDVLVASLRERADHADAEETATAKADAWYFRQAADKIERLRAALAWMIEHDESGPDDAYHLAGLERAKAALRSDET